MLSALSGFANAFENWANSFQCFFANNLFWIKGYSNVG